MVVEPGSLGRIGNKRCKYTAFLANNIAAEGELWGLQLGRTSASEWLVSCSRELAPAIITSGGNCMNGITSQKVAHYGVELRSCSAMICRCIR